MDDKERLAIAEEIIRVLTQRKASFRLNDVNAYFTEGGNWLAFENMDNPSGLVRGAANNPIDAVFLARQKLAAEREAARTPEERRLREALQEIVNAHDEHPEKHWCGVSVQIARKALEGAK